jgi:hypothetical protein
MSGIKETVKELKKLLQLQAGSNVVLTEQNINGIKSAITMLNDIVYTGQVAHKHDTQQSLFSAQEPSLSSLFKKD